MKKPKRVVSLLPSATEIVCALDARDLLVGRSHECDHPEEVLELPALTRPCVGDPGSSRGIHEEVGRLAREGRPVYEIDEEALARLLPDVILTQDLCGVCAVSERDVLEAVARLDGHEVRVVTLSPNSLAEILADVFRVARALDRREQARDLVRALEERRFFVRRRASLAPWEPRVVTLEWIDPPMVGGGWMPDLVDSAGGVALGVRHGEKTRVWEERELRRLEPDVVVVHPCGFTVDRTLAEIERLPEVLPWDAWPAVAEGRVYVADGHHLFNRPGPRIVESIELLAACLHPEEFEEMRERYAPFARRLTRDLEVVPLDAS